MLDCTHCVETAAPSSLAASVYGSVFQFLQYSSLKRNKNSLVMTTLRQDMGPRTLNPSPWLLFIRSSMTQNSSKCIC